MAEKGGGFFTGWKGIAVGVGAVAAAAGLVGTGIAGSGNNTVILVKASSAFIGNETDFGQVLYERCRTNGTYVDGDWQETFTNVPDGEGGTADLAEIKLSNLEALIQLGDVFAGNKSDPDYEEPSYRKRPESACFSVCREQFNDTCTEFTYDGLTEDRCSSNSYTATCQCKTPPALTEEDAGDNFFVFNATCMQEVRENILSAIDQPIPNLLRPDNTNTAGGAGGPDDWAQADMPAYDDAMEKSLTFLRAQWAGTLPTDYATNGNEWRKAGFVDKDNGCPASLGGSFATGDHIQSTMATAEQTGVMSLARLWWRDAFVGTLNALSGEEIGRQSIYLAQTWDPDSEEVMVGVGDQINGTTNALLMYKDFGRADFALQIGENPDNEFGQPIPVEPECTFTTPDAPAADVAAHSAAALALSSLALTEFVTIAEGAPTAAEMLEAADGLFEYSKTKAPLTGLTTTNSTDAGQVLGASQIYPTTTDSYVRSHQLWAACTLFQATGEDKYWEDATTIYTTFIQPERDDAEELPTEMEPYQLFDPVANFYNPVWWGMLCMAQSAPEYSGLEEEANLLVPRQVAGGAEDDEFIAFLLDQEFKRATRGEAAQQIWKQFVLPWITFDGALKENTPQNVRITQSPGDSFRYFDINGPADDSLIVEDGPPGVQGVFRDSAGAAVVALMYADLPGVEEDQSRWARCMAVQTVNFMLGVNEDQFSYLVGFGNNSPVNPYHKDAACPEEEDRATVFEFVFSNQTATVNPGVNATKSDELSTRLCDFLTFQGDPAIADKTRPPEEDSTLTFYSEGDEINPVMNNTNTLTGALVSSFLPNAAEGSKYTDERMICPDGTSFRNEVRTVPGTSEDADPDERCGGDAQGPVANPLSQVSVDANGALTAALAGIANLPPSFWATPCDSPADLSEKALAQYTQKRDAPSEEIEDRIPT